MSQDYKCKFCNREFTRERTLSSHMCEMKRRWMNKDEADSRLGFTVWYDFIKYVSPNSKKIKTFEDFMHGADYLGFIKFANYLIYLKPYECGKFVNWLFKMSVRLDDWQKPGTYQLYIQESSKKETAERALERTIMAMQEWGDSTGNDWREFFEKISPVTGMNMIVMGKISPWIIYSTDAAQSLIDRMEPIQVTEVTKHVDTEWWKRKLQKEHNEVNWINTLMHQFLSLKH